MKSLRVIDNMTSSLLVVGALNWGVAALAKRDAIGSEVKPTTPLAKSIYTLVAISAVYKLFRTIGPKSKQERDIQKIAKIYDRFNQSTKQLNHSLRQFNDIRLKAAKLVGRRLDTLKTG